jgi:cell volume regulation protein A
VTSEILIAVAALLLVSILASKISDRFGVPALLVFLVLGMLAGSDGPGGIYFDDPQLAQSIGILALVLILFAGGLDTEWGRVHRVLREGLLLATFGVFITALVVGVAAHALLGFTWLESMLLGAIVSSTDAAAVFAVLRSKGVGLKKPLTPLLELESGSNDPMAVFLTIGLIQLITQPGLAWTTLIGHFLQQMLLGALLGYGLGQAAVFIINRLRLSHDGLYPVVTVAFALLTFGLTDYLGGSGFLAVYLAGIVLGNHEFIHRRSLMRFHDGLAWLMQIAMFLTLGLLVFPSRLVPIAGVGLLIAAWLIFVARPLSVFLSLALSRLRWREMALVSWVGLRGALPIILATFPLLARVPHADQIFNIVFFIVLTSVLLQGTSLAPAARLLGLQAAVQTRRIYPLEYTPVGGFKSELKEFPILPASEMIGRAIFELGLPDEFLVILIAREKDFVLPSGGTSLQAGDTLLVLADRASFEQVERRYSVADPRR